MRLPKGGNGSSSKFEVGNHDMGGRTRTIADYSGPTPANLAVYFSHQDIGGQGVKSPFESGFDSLTDAGFLVLMRGLTAFSGQRSGPTKVL